MMEPFQTHRGLLATLDRANVDTDQIIPKQFLKSIARTGFGEHLSRCVQLLCSACAARKLRTRSVPSYGRVATRFQERRVELLTALDD